MSRLLEELQRQAHAEVNPFLRSVIEAKLCAYLARIGQFEMARRLVAKLRVEHGDGSSPLISAWIMLCEGLLATYSEISRNGRDRVARAQLISCAIGDRELAAVSSAWKAHLEFEFSDYESMFRSLQTGIDNLDTDNHSADARLSLVIANVYYLCGDRERAQRWFLRSRDAAVAIGDQATIDAVMYNRAAFSCAWLRAEACFGDLDRELVKLVRSEIASAMTFQHITQMQALVNIVHLSHARVLMLEEKYDLALEKLKQAAADGPFAAHNFSQAAIFIETSLCKKRLGLLSDEELEQVPMQLANIESMDPDEQMVTIWTAMQVLEGEPCDKLIADYNTKLEHLKVQYQALHAKLLADMRSFESRLE